LRIHLLVNTHRPDAIEAAKATALFLRERRCQLGTDREASPLLGVEAVGIEELGRADLMVTFGGDGTLIRGAHVCAPHGTPILGVYYGRFGFVTQCQPAEVGAALSLFFDGQAVLSERMMIQTELIRADRSVATLHSLNEAALQRAATTRMLYFEVVVNGRYLHSYPADGILVASPTGSTAYNLSAGGPIVDPRTELMILTPVTPHTLATRPLILDPSSEIQLRIETRGDAVLSCDGQSRLQLLSGDRVRVTRSPRITRLVTIDDQDFLNKVHDRLFHHAHGEEIGE